MNRAYRLVWSHKRRTWLAVSETARRRGKGGGARTTLNSVSGTLVDTEAGRKTHRFLLTTLAMILSAGTVLPALADGGAGGRGAGINGFGGSAGTTNTTTAGGDGGLGVLENTSGTVGGSGGGGAGSTGGAGGQSQILVAVGCCAIATSPNGVAAAGGAAPGASGGNGLNGSDLTRTTGGGGGGGAHGAVLTVTTTNAGATGGNGGNGGIGGFTMGGGGGGAGGYGVVIDGSGLTYTNTGAVAGGGGGSGGAGSAAGGAGSGGGGGDGGIGVYFTGSSTLNNSGSIAGGAGGGGGAGASGGGTNGAVGTDAAGVVGSNLTIINSGSIAGGGSANAITFTGGTNSLTLEAGSTITGNVDATSGTGNTLALGGTTDSSFDIGAVGAAQQYRGFNTLAQTGSATWTITGSNTSGLGWNLNGGTLSISSATGTELGSYDVNFNGGTLLTSADATLDQNMVLGGNGGFDNGGNTDTLSGTISGTGAMSFSGSGTTTLTGSNTYTGGTILSAGTLQSGAAGAFVDNTAYTVNGGTLDLNGNSVIMSTLSGGGGNIALGSAALTVNQSGNTTYAGIIGGSGTLTKDGTGTLTLTGNSDSYTGNVIVDGGALAITNGAKLSNTNGQLGSSVGRAGTVTVSGPGSSWSNQFASYVGINGTGMLNIQDNGRVNVASGGESLVLAEKSGSQGTLNIGNGGAAGILNAAAVVGGAGTATLNFNHNDSAYYFTKDGASGGWFIGIDGSTTVNLTGSGKTILTGTNTYTGGTNVYNGILQGDTSSLQGNILNNAAVIFDQTTDDIYAGDMSGSGSLTKSGAGTLTLTGANTYSGGTTVSAGTLQGDSNSLQGDITNNAAVIFDQNTDGTYAGDMSGTGALTKDGTGTLTLTGINAYTGTTYINAGTLRLGDGGITASGPSGIPGTIASGGIVTALDSQLIFNFDNQYDYSGDISGAGSVRVAVGSGYNYVVVTGTNTYTGGTSIDAGITLQVGAGGTTGSISGDVVNNGGLNFKRSDAVTFDGVISGSGTLMVNSGGNLTLTGDNTYTGNTNNFGTLQIGNGGTSGAISGNIANFGGSLIFNRANDVTYGDIISGSGDLTKSGSGTLTLTGANTYSGGTTVSAGTLQGDSNSLQGDITNNAAVTFDQADNGTYAGNMGGSGSLTKSGSGTLTLSGSNTYSGGTTVDGGALSVNGSISSATTVNTGATLKGNGSVGSVTLDSGSAIAPGNSIGTLNATSVDFSGGGIYQVEVDAAGNSDLLNVSGTATLTGGSVQVLPEAGNYNYSTDYTILTAGTLSGTFDSVSSNLAFLDPTLIYDTNNVYLNLTRNDIAYDAVATTPNQWAVGNALSTIAANSPSGDMSTLLNTINTLTVSGAQQAYDSLSGNQHATAQTLLLGSAGHLTNLLGSRTGLLAANPGVVAEHTAFTPVQLAYNGDLADLQLASYGSGTGLIDTKGSGFWLAPQGGNGTIKDTDNATGADYTWYGLYGGADTWLDNRRLIGLAIGASHASTNPSAGDISLDSLELALYGRWLDEKQYIDTSLAGSYSTIDTTRAISVGGLSRTAKADYSARNLRVAVEAGRVTFEDETHRITPFAGVRYARLDRDSFSESGAGSANLVVDSASQTSLQGRLGVRAEQQSSTASGRRYDWNISAAWAHEFRDSVSTLNAGFEGAPSTTFAIEGPALDRNRLQLGMGVSTDLTRSTSVHISYNGELAGSHSNHTAGATLRVQW